MTKQQWLVILLLGLLLSVIALPVSDKEDAGTAGQGFFTGEEEGTDAEKLALETRLEDILGSVEGVGRVKVMLMTDTQTDAGGFYGKNEEEVTGVLISCEGADNSVTIQNIQQAVMALFQVEAHKIKVMKMK